MPPGCQGHTVPVPPRLMTAGSKSVSCLPSLQSTKKSCPAEPYRSHASAQRQRRPWCPSQACWTPVWILGAGRPSSTFHHLLRPSGQSLPPVCFQEAMTLARTGRRVAHFLGWALKRSAPRPRWPSPKGTNSTQSHLLMTLAHWVGMMWKSPNLPSLALQCVILLFPDVFLIIVALSTVRVSLCSLNTADMGK